MRKLSHIIQVTLNFIASVLRRKRKGGLGYTGGHVETEAEMGVMQPLPRATRSCRRKEGLSPEPAEGMGPVDVLLWTSDLWNWDRIYFYIIST
jgi:hypothetical protein